MTESQVMISSAVSDKTTSARLVTLQLPLTSDEFSYNDGDDILVAQDH